MLTPVLRPTLPLLVALALAGPATAQPVDPDTGDAALADLDRRNHGHTP